MALSWPEDHTHHGLFPSPDECGKDIKAGPFRGHTLLRRLPLGWRTAPPHLSFNESSSDVMTVREPSHQPSLLFFFIHFKLVSHPTVLPALANSQFFPHTGTSPVKILVYLTPFWHLLLRGPRQTQKVMILELSWRLGLHMASER